MTRQTCRPFFLLFSLFNFPRDVDWVHCTYCLWLNAIPVPYSIRILVDVHIVHWGHRPLQKIIRRLKSATCTQCAFAG
jgi:hypothetical protein